MKFVSKYPLAIRFLSMLVPVLNVATAAANENYGELIFADDFERSESQELKDEPGNGWTTSSDKTADGHKQVDLVDGTLHMWTHETAWHDISTRHAFEFTDGTIGMRFKLISEGDHLRLNYTDLGLKTVHAGHLFDVVFGLEEVSFKDLKTGVMNLEIRKARKEGKLTNAQKEMLKTKEHAVAHPIAKGVWHDLLVHVEGDEAIAIVNGKEVGRFRSEGIAHPTKRLLRLLVPGHAYIDDIKIWRKR